MAMVLRLLCPVLVVTLLPLLGGCSMKSLKDENALLLDENTTLREQLADRNAALEASSQELRDRALEVSDLRRQLDEMPDSAVTMTGFEGIEGVTGSMGAGEVTATVENDILFDPGKAELKSTARAALQKVAQVLNDTYGGRSIRVAGHTDSDPIRKSGHKTNHHLGFERAFAVREFLRQRGVSDDRMYVASYGPDQPMGSKDASRRVEIVVVLN